MSGPFSVSVDWSRSVTQTPLESDLFNDANGAAWSGVWDIGYTPAGGSAQVQGTAGRLTTGTAGSYATASRIARRVTLSSGMADIVWRSRFRWPTGDECYPQIYLRAPNGLLDGTSGYRLTLDRFNNQWVAARVVGSIATGLGPVSPYTFTSGVWYWVEFGAIGSDIRVKVWQDGTTEPGYAAAGNPTIIAARYTDSTITTNGQIGINLAAGATGLAKFEIDNVSINTWFTDHTRDDVTDRVRGPISVQYGRDQNTALATSVAGNGSFALDNSSRDYSPRNTASPLYGVIKPARPVTITRVVGTTTYTIARMHTDDAPINPDVSSKSVQLSMLDNLADFRSTPISTPLYRGVRTGEAIGYVLDAAGWPGVRDLNAGATVIPYWWADTTDAYSALQDLVASEGAPALLYMNESNEICFRDRHHRINGGLSTTSQATFRSIGSVEPIMAPGFTFDAAWRNVINSPVVSVEERKPAKRLSVVWETEETYLLRSGYANSIVLQTTDPFMDAVTPVPGVDFTQTGTGGAYVAGLSRTSGTSTTLSFLVIGGDVTISDLRLRARTVPVGRTFQVSASDTTSINDYGPRGVPSGSEPVWAGKFDAQAIADTMVLQRAQPLPVVSARFSMAADQTTRLKAVLARHLSDRVTVVEAETALSDPFYVEGVTHTIAGVHDHEVVFDLEAVPDYPTARPFLLDSDALNGTAVLGL